MNKSRSACTNFHTKQKSFNTVTTVIRHECTVPFLVNNEWILIRIMLYGMQQHGQYWVNYWKHLLLGRHTVRNQTHSVVKFTTQPSEVLQARRTDGRSPVQILVVPTSWVILYSSLQYEICQTIHFLWLDGKMWRRLHCTELLKMETSHAYAMWQCKTSYEGHPQTPTVTGTCASQPRSSFIWKGNRNITWTYLYIRNITQATVTRDFG